MSKIPGFSGHRKKGNVPVRSSHKRSKITVHGSKKEGSSKAVARKREKRRAGRGVGGREEKRGLNTHWAYRKTPRRDERRKKCLSEAGRKVPPDRENHAAEEKKAVEEVHGSRGGYYSQIRASDRTGTGNVNC